MRILLINPPHTAIGSRVPNEHLPPLGLLAIGGPLIDDGHEVKLLDAEFGPMKLEYIVENVLAYLPDVILLGHSGSTGAQPTIAKLTRMIKQEIPWITIIIGGVFPSYHWQQILEEESQIDYIVRGEGEEICRQLIRAIEENTSLERIRGLAFRQDGLPVKTLDAIPIQDLDQYRIGWELMGNNFYSYWGRKRAVVVQFSRGCPYPCTYCGQSLFWKTWRHRDPKKFAAEIIMLHRKYGIEVFNFADENPTTNRKVWIEFLQEIISYKEKLILVGSCRADNIVRDADVMHLYKKAGFERFLMGIENYDAVTLKQIRKAGSIETDREAIRVLRQHNILSMATYVVGFAEEKLTDHWKSLKHLMNYDPDQVQMLYVTPHRWTPFFNDVIDKKIIQTDQRRWDYKHQVLETKHFSPFFLMLTVKLMEIAMQMRPRALKRYFHPDPRIRDAQRWYYRIGKRVWFYEWFTFFFREKRTRNGPELKIFWADLPKRSETIVRNVALTPPALLHDTQGSDCA